MKKKKKVAVCLSQSARPVTTAVRAVFAVRELFLATNDYGSLSVLFASRPSELSKNGRQQLVKRD